MMLKWLKQLLQRLGVRTTPYFGFDANELLGLEKLDNGQWANSCTRLVGPFQRGREGLVHSRLRELFEPADIAYLSSFFDAGSTYFHHDGSHRRIDFLAGPFAQLPAVVHCGVSKVLARQLQHIDDPFRLRDHAPLISVVEQTPSIVHMAGQQIFHWNWTSIMKCWQQPCALRDKFVNTVDAKLEEAMDGIRAAQGHGTPDKHWEALNDVVLQTGQEFFASEESELQRMRKDVAAEREQLIRSRAALRNQWNESMCQWTFHEVSELPMEIRQEHYLLTQRLNFLNPSMTNARRRYEVQCSCEHWHRIK